MKRFRLNELVYSAESHILKNIIPGKYISAGGLSFKKPGQRTHDIGCSCPSCDGKGTHIHKDDCEVFIILQGKGIMEIDGKFFELETGDVIVCEPGEDHHLVADKNDPCINLWLHASDSPHIDHT